MSQVEERSKAPNSPQERRVNDRLYAYMQDNFMTILSAISTIMSSNYRSENYIRQIMSSLQIRGAQQGFGEFDNHDIVQSLVRSLERVPAGSSNVQTLEQSSAQSSHAQKHDSPIAEKVDQNQDAPRAGTSKEQAKEEEQIPVANEQASTSSDEKVKPRRKRKLNETSDPVMIHCTDCNQLFKKGDGSYTRHLKEMKCSPHGCPDCGKRFKKKSYLNTHMANHTNSVAKSEEPAQKVRRVEDENNNEESNAIDLSVKKDQSHNDSETILDYVGLYGITRLQDD